MALSVADRQAITELIALHGHLVDGGELDRLGEVFTTNLVYDVTDVAAEFGVLRGIAAHRDAALALGDGNPLGHHVTNTVLTEQPDGTVTARSKAIAVLAGGRAGSATYQDTVVRTAAGWRISQRVIRGRRAPLGG
jgi:hypothetical protein